MTAATNPIRRTAAGLAALAVAATLGVAAASAETPAPSPTTPPGDGGQPPVASGAGPHVLLSAPRLVGDGRALKLSLRCPASAATGGCAGTIMVYAKGRAYGVASYADPAGTRAATATVRLAGRLGSGRTRILLALVSHDGQGRLSSQHITLTVGG